tara:strand:- start:6886 stop:8679 length:1794 start_codon:yes stop_codon:yes gene_type:complete
MKKGFTLIESLLALTIAGAGTAILIKEKAEENKFNLGISLSNDIQTIIQGVDHRISIDGYDPSLWTKTNWANEEEIVKYLLRKELVSTGSNCSGGTWTPSINSELKTKLIECNLWENRNNIEVDMNASIHTDSVGFIQRFDFIFNLKNQENFEDYFLGLKNGFFNTNLNKNKEISGLHSYEMVSLSDTTKTITTSECIKNISDCAFKASYNRSGGNEYLRVDGGNSMIGEHITFIESKGQAPMKCIRWENTNRDGSGTWTQESDEDCGIGIYNETPHPIMVDIAGDTGTFKNILLDKECIVFDFNGTNVIDTGIKSPCGTNQTTGEIFQVIDNISSKNGYIENFYVSNLSAYYIAITNIKAESITSKFAYIENKLKTDMIESFTNNGIITVNSKLTLKNLLKVENNVDITGNINATSGTINNLNAYNITNNNLTSNNVANLNKLNTSNTTTINGEFISKNKATFHNGGTFNRRIIGNEFIQLNNWVAENSACYPNGVISRTSTGKLLSCVNGYWRGSSFSPSVRIVTGNATAFRWPSKTVYCNSNEIIVGGGSECYSGVGWLRMPSSRPHGNGWYGRCDTDRNQNVRVDVYAICMRK